MSFQIERGLFRLDFVDHHAVLGVPLDAEIKDIRKRYLKIARRLHPDSCASESDEDKLWASQVLSKLVNPAWEKLSQERDRSEYALVLKLKGQQARQQQSTTASVGGLAQQLLTASNPDHFYHTSLKDLASKQFEHLDQTLEIISQISELNLVYLMRKESSGDTKQTIFTGSNLPDSSQAPPQTAPSPASARPQHRQESPTEQCYRRAEVLLSKNNFAQAILDLREALRLEPNNSRCHSLMGMIYLKQNQATMAKIHFNQALKLNPQDPMALEGKQKLEQAQNAATAKAAGKAGTTAANPKAATPTQKTNPKTSKPNDKPGGGGLFGLFGGKKK